LHKTLTQPSVIDFLVIDPIVIDPIVIELMIIHRMINNLSHPIGKNRKRLEAGSKEKT